MIEQIQHVFDEIQRLSTYSKNKSDKHGEIFTPPKLINNILDQFPNDIWSNKTKTWFDPAAGHGNFHIIILQRLFKGLSNQIPNERDRVKHIVEKQLYFSEYQEDLANNIKHLFTFGGLCKPNVYVGDTLKMPNKYF
jgi:type I restriction-modification system DNA methylase subunit